MLESRDLPSNITEFAILPSGATLNGIVAGSDGALWFGDDNVPRVGRITTGGTPTSFGASGGSGPQGITAGPDGALWFTEKGKGQIGRLTDGKRHRGGVGRQWLIALVECDIERVIRAVISESASPDLRMREVDVSQDFFAEAGRIVRTQARHV